MARPVDPQKKSTIIAAARTIIIRDGYDSAKMSDIAVEAGVAPGTLYRYFESKDDLSNAMAEDFMHRVAQTVQDYLPHIGQPGGIETYIETVEKLARAEKPVLKLARMEAFEKDGVGKALRCQLRSISANILEELMNKGEIRRYDSIALADIVHGVIFSILKSCVIFEAGNFEVYKQTAAAVLRSALAPVADSDIKTNQASIDSLRH
jgi:AcrR family transcriptional regulator